MVQPPRINTFNFGAAVGAAEQIKGQRIRNALSGQALEESQRRAEGQKKVRQIRAMTENAGQAISQLREEGLHDEADRLMVQQRGMFNSVIKQYESMSTWVKDQETWDMVREAALREGIINPEDMPVKYDKSFLPQMAKRARGKLSTFEQVVGTTKAGVPERRQITQTSKGQVVAVSPKFTASADRSIAERRRKGDLDRAAKEIKAMEDLKLSASESNAIRRAVASAFNSTFNIATGQISFKDNEDRIRAQTAIEEAERSLKAGEYDSIGSAVTAALRTIEGVKIPQTTELERARNLLGLE